MSVSILERTWQSENGLNEMQVEIEIINEIEEIDTQFNTHRRHVISIGKVTLNGHKLLGPVREEIIKLCGGENRLVDQTDDELSGGIL